MSARSDLLDYRRRTFDLYADVRRLHDGDPHSAHAHWRAVRDQLFGHHPQSALPEEHRTGFRGLRYYDYDPSYAVVASINTDVATERFDVETSTGAALTFERFGYVEVPWGTLDVFWIDVYGGGVFIPLRDGTAGDTTYGGGRYLLDTVKGADLGSTPSGQLVLDFNFAFHPSCHYNPAWSCPLAPPGNRLDARIEAGEQAFAPNA